MKKITDTKISKFLSLVLRHKPETIKIDVDRNGWTDIDVLIKHAEYYKKMKFTWNDLERIVQENDKQRFSISGCKIRANQGHSIKLDMDFKELEPPRLLFHGTTEEALTKIYKSGEIIPMGRHHVHLSGSKETALAVSARRTKKPLYLWIYAKRMYDENHKFYISENGVWLVEKVPIEYIYAIWSEHTIEY